MNVKNLLDNDCDEVFSTRISVIVCGWKTSGAWLEIDNERNA